MSSAIFARRFSVRHISVASLSRKVHNILQPSRKAFVTRVDRHVGLWGALGCCKCGRWSVAEGCCPPVQVWQRRRPQCCVCRHLLTSEHHHKYRSLASWKVKGPTKIQETSQEFLVDLKKTRAKVREKMDEIVQRENIWTVPNLLCMSRIALSPYLCHLVLVANHHWALGLFLLAGVTDLADGWIARTFPGQSSNLGSFLDPLADKVLVAALFLSLTYVGLIPLPLTGLIIYRDVLIVCGASYVRYKSLPPPRTLARYFEASHATVRLAPTTISKFNTAVQLSLITTALAAPILTLTDHVAFKALWWLTAATTLGSGISYIFSRDTYKFLSAMDRPDK